MRIHHRASILAAIAALTFAATGTAQTTMRFKFKEGDKSVYSVQDKTTTSTKAGGQNEVGKLEINLDLAFNVLKTDGQGSATVQFKVSRARVTMEGPKGKVEGDSHSTTEPSDQVHKVFAQIAKAMAAMDVAGTMLPTGELKDVKVSDATLKAYKSLPGADQRGDLFNPDSLKDTIANLILPKDAIGKGKTWSNKTESKTPAGKTVVDHTYTYEGPVQKDGMTLDKISVTPSVKIEADANAPYKIKIKTAKGNGDIFFNNKTGKLVESLVHFRIDQVIHANGADFDQTIDRTVTIRAKTK